MKYFGSKSVYHDRRTRDILRAYFSYLEACDNVRMPDVFRHVVNMPAERFWVSTPRATVVVAGIDRGDKLLYMRQNKREMFFEIHRRVVALRKRYPNWTLPRLVGEVVAQPAPKFYIAPGSARVIILRARKKWYEDKRKRLLAL